MNTQVLFFHIADMFFSAIAENNDIVELYSCNSSIMPGEIYAASVYKKIPHMDCVFAHINNGEIMVTDVSHQYHEINVGDRILIQITRAAAADKCAQASLSINIPGIYAVYVPHMNAVGVSKKIVDASERQRLEQCALEICKDQDDGFIIRTHAENISDHILIHEMKHLKECYSALYKTFTDSYNTHCLYRDDLHVLKQCSSAGPLDIITSDKEMFQQSSEIIEKMNYTHVNVVFHENQYILDTFHVSNLLNNIFSNIIELESGANIVIDHCEALTVIDVNSAGNTTASGLAETAAQVNTEAAQRIASELRLRDIGGIIVIDFLEMNSRKRRNELIHAFKKYVEHDVAKIKIGTISEFGILELTRKKIGISVLDAYTEKCRCCNGSGNTISKKMYETLAKKK